MIIKFSKIKHNKKFINIDKEVEIFEGDRIGIVGENGSGKTSFLKSLLGELKTDNDIEKKINNSDISVQMQSNNLITNLKVKEYFELVTLQKLTDDLGDEVVNRIKNKKIGKLSGGEHQWFVLFLVTYFEKKLYIFDEITTGLDYDNREKIISNIKNNKNLKTYMIVSHYFEEIEALCHKYMILKKGNIVAYGTLDEIKKAGNCSYVLHDEGEIKYFSTKEKAKEYLDDEQKIMDMTLKDVYEFYMRGEDHAAEK